MRTLLAILALFVGLLAARAAHANGPSGAIAIVERGPIVLDDSGVARFTLRNVGAGPLKIMTVYGRTQERDPRLPGTVTATFENGVTKADLAPQETRIVTVKWDRQGARMTQLFGHVVVESSDPGAPQVAIGIVARPPSSMPWLRHHLASWLIGLPLAGVAALLALRLARRDEKLARWVALFVSALQLAVSLHLLRAFDTLASKADGNDGYQFVERARLFGGVEWYLGVDGVSLPLVVLVSVVSLVAVLGGFRVERSILAHHAAQLALSSCMVGALVSVDAALFVAFLSAALVPAFVLVASHGGAGPRAAIKMALPFAVACALLIVLVIALHRRSEAGFLVDGTRAQPFAFPELAREDWVARTHAGSTLFGAPLVKAATVVAVLAFGVFLPLVPLHGWLGDAIAESDTGAGIAIAVLFGKLGVYGLLRVVVVVLPSGARWASPALAAWGAASVMWAALCAIGQRDLRRVVAHVAIAHAGVALLGVASTTPQGLAGAIAGAVGSGLAIAMLLVAIGAIDARVRTREIERFGGLGKELPALSGLTAVACVAAVGLPGLVGFVGPFFSVIGAFPVHRVQACVVAFGLLLVAVALLGAYGRVFLGKFDAAWRKSPLLEPFGGRFPPLDARERTLLVGLAVLVFALGLHPRPLLELSRGALVDLAGTVNVLGIAASDRALPFVAVLR